MGALLRLRKKLLAIAEKMKWLGPLLVRLTVGITFMTTGWGKLHDLQKITDFFVELHIPAPHFQAIVVASTEFVGGLLVLIGLGTRLAAGPLAITMIVAILTAKRDQIDGVSSLVGFEEFSYLVMYIWLIVAGPGPVSVDHFIDKRLKDLATS